MEKTTVAMSPEIQKLVAEHNMKPEEYGVLLKVLGREPTEAEFGVVAAMWSEHCSYKSTRIWLKTLPTKGPQVLIGPGENAGVIDIGDGGQCETNDTWDQSGETYHLVTVLPQDD